MSPPFDALGAWLRRTLLQNWPTKATALVLAAVLWAVVEAKQPTTQLVPVRLELDLPEGRQLAGQLPAVQALYAGPASELIKLYATPPVIHRQLVDSVTDVDLSPGDLTIARDIEANAQDIQPRRITLRIVPAPEPRGGRVSPVPAETTEPVAERVLAGVPVMLPGRLRGLASDPPAVAVTVRGPASRLPGLTRDSLRVSVPDQTVAPGTLLRATVRAPSGMAATASPDTVRVVTPSRG